MRHAIAFFRVMQQGAYERCTSTVAMSIVQMPLKALYESDSAQASKLVESCVEACRRVDFVPAHACMEA